MATAEARHRAPPRPPLSLIAGHKPHPLPPVTHVADGIGATWRPTADAQLPPAVVTLTCGRLGAHRLGRARPVRDLGDLPAARRLALHLARPRSPQGRRAAHPLRRPGGTTYHRRRRAGRPVAAILGAAAAGLVGGGPFHHGHGVFRRRGGRIVGAVAVRRAGSDAPKATYFAGATLFTLGGCGQLLEGLNADAQIGSNRYSANRFRCSSRTGPS